MTAGAFWAEIKELLVTHAPARLNAKTATATEYLPPVNLALQEFSALALCLFDPAVTWTVAAGTRFDLDGNAFAKAIVWPVSVRYDGALLRNLADRVGPVTLDQMNLLQGGGGPMRWAWAPPNQLLTSATTTVVPATVAGFVRHSALTTVDSLLELPGDMIRPASVFCALKLIEPRADGTMLNRYELLRKEAFDAINESAARAVAAWPGVPVPLRLRGGE